MMQYKTWTPSTGGEVTCSGGPQHPNYVMPLEARHFRTSPGFRVHLTPSTFSFQADHNEPECLKRAYVCLGALIMPVEGLDEHLESTINLLRYYECLREDQRIMREKATLVTAPDTLVAEFVGYTPRANLVIGE